MLVKDTVLSLFSALFLANVLGCDEPLDISSGNPTEFLCPQSPAPCTLPTPIPTPSCGIQDIKLLSLEHNSSCPYGADVNFLWSVKAPKGIVEGMGVLGAKTVGSFLFFDDSIQLDIKPKGNGLYEISNSSPVHVDAAAYNNSTTWLAGLQLETNCPEDNYSEPTITRIIKKNYSSACSRNDKIFINPGNPTSIAGVHALVCTECDVPNYQWPTHHKVDVYDVTGGGKTFVKSELVGWMDVNLLPYLQFGKKYRFEYRNAIYQNGIQVCATAMPFVETWQF